MMLPSELLAIIGRRRFIAEIRTESAQQALGTVDALARGGIAAFEISMAIPGAAEILHHYAASSEILVGAGGVLDARGAEEAAHAGAKFVASPIMAPDLVAACTAAHVTPILGALTPTEIIAAQRAGAELVKVFPINALGGSQYTRALFRQFAALNLLVSGGISLENLADYLALPVRAISLGSTLMPRALVERG
ncbi:MAG: 2-dehydro-3-deoxyphosphogluconate aldolase, partial [Ktedonobacterales bacterium]|nr:2-dehydro-3-deoxyphosphogluconate aldolase [Ktedonobacterales bacterium]